MDLVLNGMEDLNEQELMMVEGGKKWNSKDWGRALIKVGSAIFVAGCLANPINMGAIVVGGITAGFGDAIRHKDENYF